MSSSAQISSDQSLTVSSTTTVSNSSSNAALTEGDFVTISLAIVTAWILVSLWQRVIENFAFGTLGLNDVSTFHALIVAATITTLLFVIIWIIDTYNLIPGGIAPELVSAEGAMIPSSETAGGGGGGGGGGER